MTKIKKPPRRAALSRKGEAKGRRRSRLLPPAPLLALILTMTPDCTQDVVQEFTSTPRLYTVARTFQIPDIALVTQVVAAIDQLSPNF